MIVSVVISRTTLVPAVSFSLSTLLRQPTTYLGPLLALTITETTNNHAPQLLTNPNEQLNPKSNVIKKMKGKKQLQDKQIMHTIHKINHVFVKDSYNSNMGRGPNTNSNSIQNNLIARPKLNSS